MFFSFVFFAGKNGERLNLTRISASADRDKAISYASVSTCWECPSGVVRRAKKERFDLSSNIIINH